MNQRTPATLARRAPFDRAARHGPFVDAFLARLPERPHVVAVGDGIGSTVAWLRDVVDRDWTFTVVDTDPSLLDKVPRTLAHTERRSIAALDEWDVSVDAVLVAELDRVDFEGLALLAQWVARAFVPVLAGPTPDGTQRWLPAHEHDDAVLAALRLRERATASGPNAAHWFADHLRVLGYEVELASVRWAVETSDGAMVRRLVEQTAAAASAIHPDWALVEAWRHTRLLQARADVVEVSVGQWDLVGIPGHTAPLVAPGQRSATAS